MDHNSKLALVQRFLKLPAGQRRLFLDKLQEKGVSLTQLPIAQVEHADERVALSYAQQRQWFLWQLAPDSATYHIPTALRLYGPLQRDALQRSFDRLIERHSVLRTAFVEHDGLAAQQIMPARALNMAFEVLNGSARDEAQLVARVEAEIQRPFDLACDCLLRVRLMQVAEEHHVLVLTLHHIIADGWSMQVMVEELIALYSEFTGKGASALPALPIQYVDYAHWQRAWMEAGERDRQLAYWTGQLGGEQPQLDLPIDRPRPAQQSNRGARIQLALETTQVAGLKRLASTENLTPFVVLQACLHALLYRYSGQQDIRVGLPVSNRNRPETERLIGFFVNTLVLRTTPNGQLTFRALLAQVKQQVMGAQAHQDLPFEQLVEALQPERSLSQSPLFQVLHNHQSESRGEQWQVDEQLRVESLTLGGCQSKFDLTLETFEHGDEMSASFIYASDLFDAQTIERMARHFAILISVFSDNPDTLLEAPLLLDAAEQQAIAKPCSGQMLAAQPPSSIHALIEAAAQRVPEQLAVVCNDQHLTYRELDQRATQLARRLRALGAGPDVCVAIRAPRSVELIVAILAVFKAGAAYLPLDPDAPVQRLEQLLADSGADLLLTDSTWLAQQSQARLPHVVCLDDADSYPPADEPFAAPQVQADNLAYVIYTSGSTGQAKGVMVSHGALLGYVRAILEQMPWDQVQNMAMVSTPAADLGHTMLFGALCSARTLHLADAQQVKDAETFRCFMVEHAIDALKIVPSHLSALLEASDPAAVLPRHCLVLGGEACSTALLDQLRLLAPHCRIVNHYGPSETTVGVIAGEITAASPSSRVAMGRALPQVQIHLLDDNLQPAPLGTGAQLYVAGPTLARGYHARPGMTAERFVPNPASSAGGRLYRTGDRARIEQGAITYLGRADDQVKIRGFRVEPDEVAQRLRAMPGVAAAAVVPQDLGAGLRLVAYVVADDVEAQQAARAPQSWCQALLQAFKQQVPDYLLPGHAVLLQALPVTSNGKLDRRALPAPDIHLLQGRFEAPEGELEVRIARIWAEVLKREQVGRNENFFELGGDSIISIQVVSRARNAGIHFSARDLFTRQSVHELAQVAQLGEVRKPLEQGPVSGDLALLPIQQWFFEQAVAVPHHWNQSVLLRPVHKVDEAALEQALQALVSHHDALRLSFTGQGATHRSLELQCQDPLLWVTRVSSAQALQAACTEAQASLDLSNGPLLRGLLATLEDGSQRLLLVIHHLVVDGVSWRILFEDLQTAYAQLCQGQALQLPAKTSAYKVWSERLGEYAQGAGLEALAHWQGLRGVSADLPCDNPQGSQSSRHARCVYSRLDRETTRQLLQQAPAAYRTQVNDVLLTALARVVVRWSGQSHALIQLEGHGREELFDDVDLTRTVGWFTSLFPVCLTPAVALDDSIKAIKEQLRAVPNKGISLGVLRYLGSDTVRAQLAELPQARITFNYLGQFDGSFDQAQDLFVPAFENKGAEQGEGALLSNWLSLNGQVYDGELSIGWTFSGERFADASIERLAQDYATELKALIAHCLAPGNAGVTPADFPLAGLDQAQLDSLDIAAADIEDIYPLSPMQQGMLFHSLYQQQHHEYVNQMWVDVQGLQVERFQAAWQAALAAHDILRTVFCWQLEPAVQVVCKQAPASFESLDWRGQPDLEQALQALARTRREQGFDLARAPLLHLTVVRTATDQHRLIYTNHHILLDGWSNSQLLGEVLQRYSGERITQPPGRYRDYIGWLLSRNRQASEAFWKLRLAELPAPTHLALAFAGTPRKLDASGHGHRYQVLDSERTQQFGEFARQQKITLNTLMQAAWLLVLQRYTGQPCVTFGATVAGRPTELKGIEQQVGLFINTLPVIARVEPTMSVAQWLQVVQAENLAIRDHEHTALVDIQRWAGQGGSALFDSILVFENYPISEALAQGDSLGLKFAEVVNHEQSNYPLSLAVSLGNELSLHFCFDKGLYQARDIEQLSQSFERLLEQLISVPVHRCLGELDAIGHAERELIEQVWNGPTRTYPFEQAVHQLIEVQAERAPLATALLFAGQRLDFASLNARANRLAHALIERGVGPDVLVGIALERSLDMVVGLLAIMKAGGAYVPLDPEYPQERLAYMLADSAVSLLLTQDSLRERLPLEGLDTLVPGDWLEAYSDHNPQVEVHPDNLAYVIYTSGSTGQPKGVAVAHGPLLMHCLAIGERYEMTAQDCELHFMSFAFDGAHERWLTSLSHGASLLIRDASLWTPEQTYQQMRRHGVTVAAFPPAYLQQLAEHAEREGNPPAVRIYCFGGDAVPDASFELAKRALQPQYIINGYGPTETVVTPLIWKAGRDDGCGAAYAPIGERIGARSAYVLDSELNLVPQGIAGELYLGGQGLARGYLARAGLSAERFVADPFAVGGRLYRTGDLVRQRGDGVVEYLGRVDNQVKIRGFRIELGEIEARLLALEGVREAVVLAREGLSGLQLVAYVVPSVLTLLDDPQAQQALRDELRQHLRSVLPDYMVPAQWLLLAQLPLTPNGKLDRKALPTPDASAVQGTYAAPVTALEQELASLWAQVLKLERVGRHDNFFELGGDSIISIQLVSRARAAGIQFSPKDLFNQQTIQELAQVAQRGESRLHIDQGPVSGTLALLPIQQWFFEQPIPDPHHWNQSVLLRPQHALHAEHLERALRALVIHHDALRLSFQAGAAGWRADHRSLEQQEQLWQTQPLLLCAQVDDAQALEAACEQVQRSLDLQQGPLLRALLATLADGSQRLLLVIHHLVVDGVSWRILFEDLQALYAQLDAGQALSLAQRTSSFQAWGERLQQYARSTGQAELGYWQAQLQDAPVDLPCDRPDGSLSGKFAGSVQRQLNPQLTRRLLQQAPAAYRTQVNDLLLTALARVISRWSEQSRVLIQMEGHGREELFDDIDLTRTVGWFTSLFPVCLSPQPRLEDSIKVIKEQLRAIPNKGLGLGLLQYLGDDASRAQLRDLPQPRITFNYLGQFDSSFDDEQGLFVPAEEGSGSQQHAEAPLGNWLSIGSRVYGGELNMTWTFSRDLFDAATIERLAQAYCDELAELIEYCCTPEHGALTPSDVPLAGLSQEQLDALPVAAREIDDIYPLSPMQQGMLFHALYQQGSGDYINQMEVDVSGLDVERFRAAWQQVLASHDILRSQFIWQLEQPRQIVCKQTAANFSVLDWSARDEQAQALNELAQQDRAQGFDLAQAPLVRLTVVRTGEARYRLIYTSHHILMDGWSNSQLLGELLQRYAGEAIAPHNGRFSDYIAWLQCQDMQASEVFWRSRVARLAAPTSLSQAVARHPDQASRSGHADHYHVLDEQRCEQLNAFARQHKVTLNTVVQAAWLLLLQRFTGQSTVAFGATVAGRPAELKGIERQVGLFINTLPVVASVASESSVSQWLQQVQQENLAAREHEHTPLFEIQRWSGQAGAALFDNILVFENYPVSEALAQGADIGLVFGEVQNHEQTSYPLSLAVNLGKQMSLHFSFDLALFDASAVEQFGASLDWLLEQLVGSQPDTCLGQLGILRPTALQATVGQWNDTHVDYALDWPVHAR
ncbi:MAG: amino acid adenylation domain-containing protein, partial [Pseudomonas sp.]